MNSLLVTQQFLNHIFSGNMEEALKLVAADAKFIPTQPKPHQNLPLSGTFVGPEGARQLFARFAEVLEPGDFNVESAFSEGEHVAMYGNLRHRSRQTGRDFCSDWALISRVNDGKLTLYHFYEDTFALFEALK